MPVDAPNLVPPPPPPDWTVESEVRKLAEIDRRQQLAVLARRRAAVLAMHRDALRPRGTGSERAVSPRDFEIDTSCSTVVASRSSADAVPTVADRPTPVAKAQPAAATWKDMDTGVVSQAARQPRDRARSSRERIGLGLYVGVVALLCVSLGVWQSYWSLRASEGGRAVLERAASFTDQLAAAALEPVEEP